MYSLHRLWKCLLALLGSQHLEKVLVHTHTQCDHHLSCELFGLVLEGCNLENVECCNSIIHVNVGMF